MAGRVQRLCAADAYLAETMSMLWIRIRVRQKKGRILLRQEFRTERTVRPQEEIRNRRKRMRMPERNRHLITGELICPGSILKYGVPMSTT